jgi:hypothetical protein
MMRSVTDTRTRFQGVYARHRKTCTKPKTDGRCCGAGFYATVYDASIGRNVKGPTKATAGEANRWRTKTRMRRRAEQAEPAVQTLGGGGLRRVFRRSRLEAVPSSSVDAADSGGCSGDGG